MDSMSLIEGSLFAGLGKAADFTSIEWVRRQLHQKTGIDPHPGTVNLRLEDSASLENWRDWCSTTGIALAPGEADFCSARCYPVRIGSRIPAAVVVPQVPGYPHDKLELVAALAVRSHLALAEGGLVSVELCRPYPARAVIFDIDGTMVDSLGAYLEVARLASAPFGVEISAQQVRSSLGGNGRFWDQVLPEDFPKREAAMRQMSAHAARAWPKILREHARVFAGLAQTLDTLKQSGMLLGIVSGARAEVLELLREDGVLDRFDAVVLGEDVARRKPDPEGLLKCLAKLHIDAGQAAYVGDTQVDIQASRSAGMHAVAVLSGAADSAQLSLCEPDRLIWSHASLPQIVRPA